MGILSRPSLPDSGGIPDPAVGSPEDEVLDMALRPRQWNEFIGQDKLKRNLQIMIEAAQKRGEPYFEHLLFYGSSGLGKTSLAYLIAKQMKSTIRVVNGPSLKKIGDLAAILTNLNEGDILFCDECHRMNKNIEEFLYPALEDFQINIILGKGPMARTLDIKLPRFVFIGATTQIASLSSPLRNRFGGIFQLNFYDVKEIEKVITRSAQLLAIGITPEAAEAIAQRSRLTPRVANRLLRRVRDFSQVKEEKVITLGSVEQSLEFLEIDRLGLEAGDKRILQTLIEKFNGGPAGLQALAAASNEEENTILDIYEPYLMQLGFIERTPRGRTVTKRAYQHLGIKPRHLL